MKQDSLLVVVGSTNPVKIASVAAAVSRFWPDAETIGQETTSGVSAQPISDEEMRMGALERARQALESRAEAHFGVGIEGGVLDASDGMWAYAWVLVTDRAGRVGRGQSGRFLLPPPVATLVRGGMELGSADDLFFGRQDSKRKEGAVGILSVGQISRRDLYQPAVTFALFPFLHPEIYHPTP